MIPSAIPLYSDLSHIPSATGPRKLGRTEISEERFSVFFFVNRIHLSCGVKKLFISLTYFVKKYPNF